MFHSWIFYECSIDKFMESNNYRFATLQVMKIQLQSELWQKMLITYLKNSAQGSYPPPLKKKIIFFWIYHLYVGFVGKC